MSETTTLWLFGTLITLLTIVIGAIAAALWAHVGHCKETSATVARIDTNLKRVMDDVGSHETGLRGQVHSVAKFADQLEKRVAAIEWSKGQR